MSWKRSLVLVGTAAVAFAAGRAARWDDTAFAAQPAKDHPAKGQPAKPDKPGQPGQPPAMPPELEAFMSKMRPGEQHKRLDVMVGTWEGTVKFWMDSNQPPMESTGRATREWTLDGMFLIEHVDGETPGMPPFKGLGLVGYNTIENRYESVWVENMSTYIAFMTGSYDAAKKTLTFQGDMIDPMTGKRAKQRHTLDLSDPNKEVAVGYGVGPDGKEFKNFEGTFTRKK